MKSEQYLVGDSLQAASSFCEWYVAVVTWSFLRTLWVCEIFQPRFNKLETAARWWMNNYFAIWIWWYPYLYVNHAWKSVKCGWPCLLITICGLALLRINFFELERSFMFVMPCFDLSLCVFHGEIFKPSLIWNSVRLEVLFPGWGGGQMIVSAVITNFESDLRLFWICAYLYIFNFRLMQLCGPWAFGMSCVFTQGFNPWISTVHSLARYSHVRCHIGTWKE